MAALTEVTLVLRPATPLPRKTPDLPQQHLTHAEMKRRHGADPAVRDRILQFAARRHLRALGVDPARRTARLTGSTEQLAAAFPVSRRGEIAIPASLASDVDAVLAPDSQSPVRRAPVARDSHRGSSRSVQDLADAYDFPAPADATGQTIGLIEFGGGFYPEDLKQFCRRNRIPVPQVTVISVDRARNSPAPRKAVRELLDAVSGKSKLAPSVEASDRMQAAMSTIEVTMDIEMLAALAPGAHIVVYFAPCDRQFHALHRAIYDHRHKPSVLSVSWGQPETEIRKSTLRCVNSLLETAAHLGITVCTSSGDHGACDDSPDGLPSVNFPASSPFCLSCGGTTTHFVRRAGRLRVLRETVWNSEHYNIHGASGGGVSRVFPTPLWQRHADVPPSPTRSRGRGVPDVAGVADPRFGCELLIAGRTFTSAGTSAVAPLWAALMARCNAALDRRCGHINPHLYRLAAERRRVVRPVTKGTNGVYKAHPGWNPCTGHGTPVGSELLRSLEEHFNAASLPGERPLRK